MIVEKLPSFPGGQDSLLMYLAANLKYPIIAKEKKITGEVVVQFIIEVDGNISGAKVLDSLGYGCDEEALRVVREMPKWTPGKIYGQSYRFRTGISVKFELP